MAIYKNAIRFGKCAGYVQRLIDALFGPECEPYVFCYLDDIIVVTQTFDEHIKWLEIVLRRIVDAGLVEQRKKCKFCCARVTYLGYLLDHAGLRPDPERIAPVLNYPTSRNDSDVRTFLGRMVHALYRKLCGDEATDQ